MVIPLYARANVFSLINFIETVNGTYMLKLQAKVTIELAHLHKMSIYVADLVADS